MHACTYKIKIMNSDKYLLLLLLLSLTTLHFTNTLAAEGEGEAAPAPTRARLKFFRPEAIFGFGDSIIDPGNNNNRKTGCRSDHAPYGVSLGARQPSGRFSDGKLPLDILVTNMRIKEFLPGFRYQKYNYHELTTGVSFGAACTGLDPLTARAGNVPRMTKQLRAFARAVKRIRNIVGTEEADEILFNSLFFVAAGTSDMINNYYTLPLRKEMPLSIYQDMLIRNLEKFIKRLMKMGGVRFAVAGLPPIGCLPSQVTVNSVVSGSIERECYEERNLDSADYNTKLQNMISRLELSVPECRFAYVDIYNPILHMVQNPTTYGFEKTLEGCCGSGTVEMGIMCNDASEACKDPYKYVFFDAAHPTQKAYNIMLQHFQFYQLPYLTF